MTTMETIGRMLAAFDEHYEWDAMTPRNRDKYLLRAARIIATVWAQPVDA